MKSAFEAMSIPPRIVRSSTEALLKAAKIGPELTRASLDSMQDSGGTFGRGRLEGRIAGGPKPTGEDNLFRWGEGAKGNLLESQYAANEPSRDWLEAERISSASNAPQITALRYFVWVT